MFGGTAFKGMTILKQMGDTPVCHVCSLGTRCQSSQLLLETGLKKESYPFDWVFSSPADIEHILDDDFRSFLNKEMYGGKGPDQCDHTLYGNRMFNHHNPKDNDDHYLYFTRCVGRFRELLGREKGKLFVMTFLNLENDAECVTDVRARAAQFNLYLSSKTCNYRLFVICHVPHCDVFGADVVDVGNIRFVTLHTTSLSDGVHLTDGHEDAMLRQLLLDGYDFKVESLDGSNE